MRKYTNEDPVHFKSILPLALATLIANAPLVSPAWSQNTPVTSGQASEAKPDRGWNGLANVLDAITPSVQTEEPPSGAEINASIAQQLNRGQAQKAFDAIEKREGELRSRGGPGTDVQLMFQKARALALLNRTAEAEQVYRDMTIRFPELPEPWNNLAVLYIARNDLDQARLALETAIMNNPNYTAAISNLADLRLLMALRGYEQAASLGSRQARARAAKLKEFLTQQP